MLKMIRFLRRKKDREQKSKPSTCVSSHETNERTKKLTDLNDDCLEHIFLYLSLEDLLNIVYENKIKRLIPAAESAFKRNLLRRGLVSLGRSTVGICLNDTEEEFMIHPYRFLRGFGHLVLKLQTYRVNTLKYVNKYCSELTEIELKLFNNFYLIKMKTFPNVETVKLTYCFLYSKFEQFFASVRLNEIFPNVRNLSIRCSNLKPKYIAMHFSHLNQLKLNLSYMERVVYRADTYVKLLRMNPQLRCLSLNTQFNVLLLRAASQYLQFLEQLHFSFVDQIFRKCGDEVLHFPHLKELKISCYGSNTTKIPILANSLSAFLFVFCDSILDMDSLLEFLHRHQHITNLNLILGRHYQWNMQTTNTKYLLDIIRALPSMEEIDISLLTISVDDAIRFVDGCKSLKKLCFKTYQNVDLAGLEARLRVEWQLLSVRFSKLMEYEMYIVTVVKR